MTWANILATWSSLIVAPAFAQTTDLARDERLNLLGEAAIASFYAADSFRCKTMSFSTARRVADRALGHNFQSRFVAAANKLRVLYGAEAVERSTTILPIGHKLTPFYCKQAETLVPVARSRLAELEKLIGIP